jgi:hypothetical protein
VQLLGRLEAVLRYVSIEFSGTSLETQGHETHVCHDLSTDANAYPVDSEFIASVIAESRCYGAVAWKIECVRLLLFITTVPIVTQIPGSHS